MQNIRIDRIFRQQIVEFVQNIHTCITTSYKTLPTENNYLPTLPIYYYVIIAVDKTLRLESSIS